MCAKCADELEHLRNVVKKMREQIALLVYELEESARDTLDLSNDAKDLLRVCK